MGSKTLRVSGFPLGTTAREVKDFLESITVVGAVFVVKIRSRSKVSAIVQFTRREDADSILERASGELRFSHNLLVAYPARDVVYRPRVPWFELGGVTLHLGCPLSEDRLSVLFSCENVKLNFSRNLGKIVFFLSWGNRFYKLECSYGSIWEMRHHKSGFEMRDFLVIMVVAAPRIYTLPDEASLFSGPKFNYYQDPNHDERWVRTTDFTESCSIGEASAFCLELPLESNLPNISEMFDFHKEVNGPLRLERGSSYSQDLELVPIVRARGEVPVPYETLFRVNHMVQNGTLSGPTLDDDFFRLLDPRRISQSFIDRALDCLSYSNTCCLSPENCLREQYKKMETSKLRNQRPQAASCKISLQSGLVYVHRAQVTPTKVYFYGPEINISNRVIRHFIDDLENFMRVSFVDEDGERLWSADLQPRNIAGSSDKQTKLYRRLQSILGKGIAVGGKRFDFLAFSASQLKDSSVWMFASRPGLCATDIRRWMGDFSGIRNVAKYAARLGQSFGSSTETLSVARHETEMIPDVENYKYCFSDGIGKISAAFASQVAKKCDLSSTPSAFQIRYGGFKGVVAVDPSSRVKLSLRKSMCKFESGNTKLDVLAYSKPQFCFLNRQLITLLSTLGVEDKVFLRKQEELVKKLDELLSDPATAMEVLSAISPGEMAGILKEMLNCGYVPQEEPFLSMMLQTFRAAKLNELRTKSRIFVPMGRAMMGCLDETCTLEYGQVFIQVTSASSFVLDGLEIFPESSRNGAGGGSVIIKGMVVVSKNPCLHPGDLRVLKAVDVWDLHHLVDCVVFPQKGKRPHPNECSGSDLDGDIYFVTWDPELIPPHLVEPMDYTPAPQTFLQRDVTIEDVEEYFLNYLINDSMGIIANAHTVFADREPERAMSPRCKDLAKLFSIAVDFPKTGVPAIIPPHLAVKEFPDFMEKHDRTLYQSKSVIGKLFRAARDKDPSCTPLEFTHRQAARCYDPDLELDGFENYLDEAFFFKGEYDFKLGNLMSFYKIKTEAEILFGVSTKLSKGFNRQRDGDAVHMAIKSLKKEVRSWFNCPSSEKNVEGESLLAKASAWYHVTYHKDYWGCYNEGLDRPHLISFPWCVHEKLILIKTRQKTNRLAVQMSSMRI